MFKQGNKQEMLISRPEPPVKTSVLVATRTITSIYMLLSAISIHMALAFRPWRQEWLGKPKNLLEYSVWHVCRSTPKGTKCYEGELDNAPGWFLCFRWFLMLAVFSQYIAALFTMVSTAITKNATNRQFWIPAFMSLSSALMILIAMLVLTVYKEFEFIENARLYRMGWKMDEPDVEDKWAWPYYLTWCNFGICMIGFFICLFTHFKDTKWTRYIAMEGMRHRAENMMR